MPGQLPKVRNWKQQRTWKTGEKAGTTEVVNTPIWWHVCFVCDHSVAPFGHTTIEKGGHEVTRYYCREHDPVRGK